jgi:hypothetical protein
VRGQVEVVGPEPKSQVTIREMARAAARDAVGRAVGAIADDAEPEWPPLANTASRLDEDGAPSAAAASAVEDGPAREGAAGGGTADGAGEAANGAAQLRLEDQEDELALESNGEDSDEIQLESNDAEETGTHKGTIV